MATPKRRRPWWQIKAQEEIDATLAQFTTYLVGAKPETTTQAIRASTEFGLEAKLAKPIVEGATIGALVKHGTDVAELEWGLLTRRYERLSTKIFTKAWAADGIQLSKRLYRDVRVTSIIIKQEVARAKLQSDTIAKVARRLADKIDPQEIRQDLKTLTNLAKMQLSATAKAEILAEVSRIRGEVATIQTKGLRSGYNRLLNAIERGKVAEIDAAYKVASEKKARYVAQRTARTEMARSEHEGWSSAVVEETDAVGVRYSLSTGHNVDDICDVHTSIDLGFGVGVYPLTEAPEYPFHPKCFCNYERVYSKRGLERETKVSQKNIKDAGDSVYKGWSKEKRQSVMGIAKEAEWSKGKDWRNLQTGFNGLGQDLTKLRFDESDFVPS